ncbi:MAG TPA: LemA family protein [Bacteroidales bacterium]|nr:LemA family protein [Bacteroidales bacterium]HNV96199.1 LemA family protein [Bacteroidales bacterium]
MGYSYYNGLVTREEKVNAQWAQVENLYQQRADLVNNLVATVKGYATHENKTLTEVVEARAKATSINVSPEKLDEASLKSFEDAQQNLSSSLSRLLVTVENYPDLKANQNFIMLQGQLQQIETNIAQERNTFNEVARDYNTAIRKFPRNMFASMFNFEAKAYFKAQEGADKAPKVSFE